jgi:hypothetical protein
MKRLLLRWLFRRLFGKVYNPRKTLPRDGQEVLVLDADRRHTWVWLARYDASTDSYFAGGGWFEHDELDYWTPLKSVENPLLVRSVDTP